MASPSQVADRLELSYKSSKELNKIIDTLPSRPKFHREEVIVAGEAFDVYFRDVLECVQALFGNPEFTSVLAFAPERHYADADETIQLYHEMWTGKWWWNMQVGLVCS
jgi:Plavaka transposase